MPSISLCMICKDEEGNLAQCLDSVRGHVDEIIVVDTGSTDRTKEVAVQYGASVYQYDQRTNPESFFVDSEEECQKFGAPGAYSGEWALGDFAAARNFSFDKATGDYVVWIDADDVLENPKELRSVVADMESRGLGFGFLAYNYAQDHLGRVYYRQWRERVFRRGTARWHGPVHEVLMPTGAIGAPGRYDAPVYSHKRKADRKGIAHRNYKILLRQVWQLKTANPNDPIDPRILFYLGQEARFVEPQRAAGFYEEYLQSSGWAEERCAAHCAIGTMLEFGILGPDKDQCYAQADREYATAACEMPENPDGLFGLARIAYLRGRFQDCANYTERAMKVGNTDSMLGANPMDRLYRPHVFYNHALAQLGRVEEAIKSCEAGLAVMPDDPGIPGGAPGMLKNNLLAYQAEMARRQEAQGVRPVGEEKKPMVVFDKNEDVDAPPVHGIPRDAQVIWAMQLWKQVIASGDHGKAQRFLESLPSSVSADPVIDRMFQATRRKASGVIAKPNESDGVVFYLGPGPEPWDPNTPNTKGLGGSETAAIEMAKHLTALGNRCVVYAETVGAFDGVEYRHHSTFKGCACDVFIASRTPWSIDQLGPVDAKLRLLWVHDIHCGPNSPQMERWLLKFDRILCLSNWHKDYFLSLYPSVHPDTVICTRNGIDPSRFSIQAPKTNSMVFSSSPNRGLDYLLHVFPQLKSHVPDLELHIYYGFDTWETFAKQRNGIKELSDIARYRRSIDEAVKRGGVFFHGKRPQTELAQAFLRAKLWAYPTEFPETSCITAMEAMAAGAVPVCTRFAALGETVKHGVLIDPSPDYGDKFLRECVRVLTDESYRSPVAEAGRKWATENLSWKSLADDWSAMFGKLKEEVTVNPIPLWKAA